MEWDLVLKAGKPFKVEGRLFYDLAVTPHPRRMVVCGVGVLHPQYGFCWYYTPSEKPEFTRNDAAKVLVNQFRFSLIDHRSFLLAQGKLTNQGEEAGFVQNNRILESRSNRFCSDRDYEAAAV